MQKPQYYHIPNNANTHLQPQFTPGHILHHHHVLLLIILPNPSILTLTLTRTTSTPIPRNHL